MLVCSRIIFIVFIGMLYPYVYGQSNDTLTFEQFITIVKEHHPEAKQANLQERLAQAELLMSRGNFDPVLFGDLNQKYFDQSQYYDLLNAGLKLPTWFGIELYSGVERAGGAYFNPENRTPNTGLVYTGLSIPLGQNLVIDHRRAALKRAKIMVESSTEEKRMIYNQLIKDAAYAYWDWFKSYNSLKVYQEAVELAIERFEATIVDALSGERPSIDTVEASIQVQDRMLQLLQAELDFQNAGLYLSVFLWAEGTIPLEIKESTTPPVVDDKLLREVNSEFLAYIDTLTNFHPELKITQFQLDKMNITRRLKQEMLKPRVNLKYNLLSEPITNSPLNAFAINNYRWGVDVSYPLFLRRERGDLNLIKLEIQETEYQFKGAVAEINYEIKSALNEWKTTHDQFLLFRRTVRDYFTLLEGERRLFDLGESSLFLINARELGYINAQVRLISILTQNRKAEINTIYTSGLLFDY
jgi:outer membrane protein TolC